MNHPRWSPIVLALLLAALAFTVSFTALLSAPHVVAQASQDPPPEHTTAVKHVQNLSQPPEAPHVAGPWPASLPWRRPPARPAPLAAARPRALTASPLANPAAPSDDFLLRANVAHNWVEGNYEAGHSVWITLTDSAGTVKAVASGETGPIPWWGGQSGFSTDYNVPWYGAQTPDIEDGDWVYGALDGTQLASVRIGTIDGVLDVAADTISGTMDVPWFNDPLDGNCNIWIESGPPGIPLTVDPDGGAYLCDFTTVGWDIVPGQTVAVDYQEPDGDMVINIFEEPAPQLAIDKWANGQPAQGGNAVYYLEYRNEGGGPAEDVLITDTMQGLSYLSDSSGLPSSTFSTPTSSSVVWDVGTVDPGVTVQFAVFGEVTAAGGDIVTNTAQIATSNPYNTSEPWQMVSTWVNYVAPNDTHLDVGKNAWTWDPAPGQYFVYNVNVCNNGSTDSAAVTLTDTLPLSTTLDTWWAQDAGWQEVASDAHSLVVSLPSLAAWSCGEVYLNVLLDAGAELGSQLLNTATIGAANDLEFDDNEATIEHTVTAPYADLAIEQTWHWGTLVPGGELHYGINFGNQGNLPAAGPVRITDTIPVSTSFQGWQSWGSAMVTLVQVSGDQVVWEVAGLANGLQGTVELALDVDPSALPGTLLVNQADIAPQPAEVDLANNHSTWQETLFDHGPNLRLRKTGDWHGFGEGHNAYYHLEVENVGDQSVSNVTITDTYPAQMALDGEPGVDYWQMWSWADDPGNHTFTVTLESLEPTWVVPIDFNTVIPDPDPVDFGLLFTNTASVDLAPGDAYPDDNQATFTLGTGPDLYVEKSLVEGDPLPGELLTFLLRFGNAQPGHAWWWNAQGNVYLVDTLPPGMSYVSAVQRWCAPEESQWCERDPDLLLDGRNLVWNTGAGGAGSWNEILLTVRLTEEVMAPGVFTNWASVVSDRPALDVEPILDNNSSSVTVVVGHYSYLPLIIR